MNAIKKILITRQGKKFYAKNLDEDLHTQYGFIKKDELKKAKDGDLLKSNTNKEFLIFNPSFIDFYRKIKRDAQIIPLKDIGLIIAETGINKESRILDAGSGSGALACFLAGIAKEVVTYEIREDFIEIVKSNVDFLSLKNILSHLSRKTNKSRMPKPFAFRPDFSFLNFPFPFCNLNSFQINKTFVFS